MAYDPSGNQLWVARYRGPSDLSAAASAIAVDSTSGNIYVTGSGEQPSSANEYATVAYDSRGNQLWASRYGPDVTNDAFGIVVNGSGNIYVTGSISSGRPPFHTGYATVAYNSDGSQLWEARYNGPANTQDFARAIAIDPSRGNIYVTGSSDGGASKDDYATVAYDSGGHQLWVSRYNGPANGQDEALAIAVDSLSGNIYVTGSSDGGASRGDYATVAYDSSGNQLWVARYNGPGNGDDTADAIAVDSTRCSIYVTGGSYGGLVDEDATVAYDSNSSCPTSNRALRPE